LAFSFSPLTSTGFIWHNESLGRTGKICTKLLL
jgi:hypothetical protein